MKQVVLLLLIVFFISCDYHNDDVLVNQLKTHININKRYGVKSGVIKYKITLSGNVMENEVSGAGFENYYFDNWGIKSLKEEEITKTTKAIFFNKVKEEKIKIHKLQKIEGDTIFKVDFYTKKIYKLFNKNIEVTSCSNQILNNLGGEKLGTEIYKGYDCEIWNINGTKQWLYKGIPLKIEHTLIGVKTIKEAVIADFNVIIVNNQFELPNYPIIKK